jgi:hypothetical protein
MRGLNALGVGACVGACVVVSVGCHPGWYTARYEPASVRGKWAGTIEVMPATTVATSETPSGSYSLPVLTIDDGPSLRVPNMGNKPAIATVGGRAVFVDSKMRVQPVSKFPFGRRVEVTGKMVDRGVTDDRGNELTVGPKTFALVSDQVRVLD